MITCGSVRYNAMQARVLQPAPTVQGQSLSLLSTIESQTSSARRQWSSIAAIRVNRSRLTKRSASQPFRSCLTCLAKYSVAFCSITGPCMRAAKQATYPGMSLRHQQKLHIWCATACALSLLPCTKLTRMRPFSRSQVHCDR